MFTFEIDCPNEGLGRVMTALNSEGIRTDSRNGPVIRFPKPVCLEYPDPRRRWLDHPVRAGNHFFHLFETLWMLAGSDLVAPLDPYNSGMKQYSDDGVRFAAAYGHRWRKHFGFDQLIAAVAKLRVNPEDRRIVIQMWDPAELQKLSGKDFACNQQILLDTRPSISYTGGYALDMTVTNRSNDLIYGAMGSNLVHFSLLHEWLAHHAGLELGTYCQISTNMHLYLENEVSKRCWERRCEFKDFASPPPDFSLTEFGAPLEMQPYEDFVLDHLNLTADVRNTYVDVVAFPICAAYLTYKDKDLPFDLRIESAIQSVKGCASSALEKVCGDWLERVKTNHEMRKIL